MGDYTFLFGVALTLMAALLSPGPSFVFVARTAAAVSRRNAIAVAVGLASGSALFAATAAFGLFVVLETVPWLYTGLRIAGGVYLCYIGLKLWRNAKSSLSEPGDEGADDPTLRRSYLSGLLIQLSNPKTAIVFAGVFAAFLPSTIPDHAYTLLILLSFFLAGLWYGAVAIVLSLEKPRTVYTSMKHLIDRIAGALLGALGLRLATDIEGSDH
ncbi:MAG: LysE family transporter [Pseudomonadota bacterium]